MAAAAVDAARRSAPTKVKGGNPIRAKWKEEAKAVGGLEKGGRERERHIRRDLEEETLDTVWWVECFWEGKRYKRCTVQNYSIHNSINHASQ